MCAGSGWEHGHGVWCLKVWCSRREHRSHHADLPKANQSSSLQKPPSPFRTLEVAFCIFFTIELALRLFALGLRVGTVKGSRTGGFCATEGGLPRGSTHTAGLLMAPTLCVTVFRLTL